MPYMRSELSDRSCVLIILLWSVIHNGAILRVGTPLRWQTSKPFLNEVRLSGARQFLSHYQRTRDVETPNFLWGDEIEYGVFVRQGSSANYDLALGRGTEIRQHLTCLGNNTSSPSVTAAEWQPEYGSWMVEAVPRDPYEGYVADLLQVEKSLQWRRKRLHYALKDGEIVPSVSNFPMMGVSGYTHSKKSRGPIANSKLLSDAVINPHPRMQALTQNIRSRRGSNVLIRLPCESSSSFVELDAMAFGMGCCCLQVTMQCNSDLESRFLHDQLVTMSPLFLALSAATPAFQGRLMATDTRWQAISDAVDDRTPAERGEIVDSRPDKLLAGGGLRQLGKSRYSSVSRYMKQTASPEESRAMDALNDEDAGIDEDVLQMLLQGGVDWGLSMHIAHLFTRDPLVIFDDAISLDDSAVLDHFENIQSTNWRTIRWKPPALELGLSDDKEGPGWRVEFRPLEVQLTDFENAAFCIVIVLLSRTLLAMDYNFYLPMSLVEENMRRAQLQNAAVEQKFWIRRQALEPSLSRQVPLCEKTSYAELSLDEIINGCTTFPGLIPACTRYLETIGCSQANIANLQPYFSLISRKASGALPTTAEFLRHTYKAHPAYQGDGHITPEMANDVLELADAIGMGEAPATVLEALVGDARIAKLDTRQAPEDTNITLSDLLMMSSSSIAPEGLVVSSPQNENAKI